MSRAWGPRGRPERCGDWDAEQQRGLDRAVNRLLLVLAVFSALILLGTYGAWWAAGRLWLVSG